MDWSILQYSLNTRFLVLVITESITSSPFTATKSTLTYGSLKKV